VTSESNEARIARREMTEEEWRIWHEGHLAGRGELARSLLEFIRWEGSGRAVLNVSSEWLHEVAKL